MCACRARGHLQGARASPLSREDLGVLMPATGNGTQRLPKKPAPVRGVPARMCRVRGRPQGARASPPACAGCAGVPALKGGFGRPDACNGKWYAAASQKTCPCEGRPRPHVPGAQASAGWRAFCAQDARDPGSHLFCASPGAACQIAAAPYPTTHGAARSTSPDVP
jgi:hypothetical protein